MNKVTLTKLTFENYEKVLQLKPKESQKKFVEDWSTILANVYIGASENMDGKLYQSFGFYDTGIRSEDDCAFVKLPD